VRKPPASPEGPDTIVQPHPLADRLIERLRASGGVRVVDFACGAGRNTVALRRAGLIVVPIEDAAAESETPLAGVDEPFAAALSTHGFLHGMPAAIATRVHTIALSLERDGLLFATFGSSRDARFAQGTRIDAHTFAPIDGEERGVAHAFFERARLGPLLEREFIVESLEERAVDRVAGAWAHREGALRGAVHWFAVARKRSS
jgi:hypothetical protein